MVQVARGCSPPKQWRWCPKNFCRVHIARNWFHLSRRRLKGPLHWAQLERDWGVYFTPSNQTVTFEHLSVQHPIRLSHANREGYTRFTRPRMVSPILTVAHQWKGTTSLSAQHSARTRFIGLKVCECCEKPWCRMRIWQKKGISFDVRWCGWCCLLFVRHLYQQSLRVSHFWDKVCTVNPWNSESVN